MALFDVEHRTATRRLLARAVAGDVGRALHTKAPPANTAAAVLWTVAQDNDSFSKITAFGVGPMVKDLLDRFGVSSPSQRAATIMRAAGYEPTTAVDGIRLGSPELLVGVPGGADRVAHAVPRRGVSRSYCRVTLSWARRR